MKNVLNIFVMVMAIMLPSAANSQNVLFYPTKVVSPGFTEKGEVMGTVDIKPSVTEGSSSEFLGPPTIHINLHPGIHFAYSPIDNVVLYGAYDWLINRDKAAENSFSSNNNGGTFYGGKAEIGGGYYTTLGTKGIVEVMAGYANGGMNCSNSSSYELDSVYYQYTTISRDFNGRYHNVSLQAAAGFTNKRFSLKGGIKYTAQFYYDFKYRVNNTERFVSASMKEATIKSTTYSYFQPYIDIITGGKVFIFDMQAGLMSPLIGNALVIDGTTFYLTLGIGLRHKPSWNNKG